MRFSAKERMRFWDYDDPRIETGLALGISLGRKFVSKNGFTAELFLRFGRNLLETASGDDYNTNKIVERFWISLGHRI